MTGGQGSPCESAGEAALAIARAFGPVVPLCWPDERGGCGCGRGHAGHDIGKAPLTPHGFKDASIDPKVIGACWTRWPQANVGLDLERAGLVFVGPDRTVRGRARAVVEGG